MLDYRIYTFLSLCETLNYTKTATALQMTQPGVTQHIQLLEREYGARFFLYQGKTLTLTPEGEALQRHLRASVLAEEAIKQQFAAPQCLPLRLGATKTIGEFVFPTFAAHLTDNPSYEVHLDVENTDVLLTKLDRLEIDLALVEGHFDKSKYAYKLLRKEDFVGICAKNHPFAQRSVPLEELFAEHLLVRESGSGTRAILEAMLRSHNFTFSSFAQESCISTFSVIKTLVMQNAGISFVYRAVAESDDNLATFLVQGETLCGEFNYVYLPSFQESPWFLDACLQAQAEAWAPSADESASAQPATPRAIKANQPTTATQQSVGSQLATPNTTKDEPSFETPQPTPTVQKPYTRSLPSYFL